MAALGKSGCNRYVVGEARNATKRLTMHRTAPTVITGTKINQSTEVEKPGFKATISIKSKEKNHLGGAFNNIDQRLPTSHSAPDSSQQQRTTQPQMPIAPRWGNSTLGSPLLLGPLVFWVCFFLFIRFWFCAFVPTIVSALVANPVLDV